MVDMLTQAFTSLQAASQLAQALIGVRDSAMIDAKVIDLNAHLIQAQSSTLQAQAQHAAMIEQVRALKEQIAQMEEWTSEKKRYQLTSPWVGFYTYAMKELESRGEPPHWICQACYEKGIKSILQRQSSRLPPTVLVFQCQICNFEVRRHTDPQYV